jgi:SDR family mycofactocin-dependent oxidoreductase
VNRVDGKVAFVTGAARGQGRAHATKLAEEGADIIAVDICEQVSTAPYPLATTDDLKETVRIVEGLGRRIMAREADVRDSNQLQSAIAEGVSEFGRVDIAVANAGMASVGLLWEISDEQWNDVLDIDLTGVWKSAKAVIPTMIEQRSGSIILTSSVAGLIGVPRLGHYTAAKHGVTGLGRALAAELAPYAIRVNTVHPGNVNTLMMNSPGAREAFMGSGEATQEQFEKSMGTINAFPIPWVDAADVSNAVLYLASDEARWVTGTQQVVDAGSMLPHMAPRRGW